MVERYYLYLTIYLNMTLLTSLNEIFDRRAIMTKRAVRVNSQLKSHKRFANAFPKYCKLVDNARLYCTNAAGHPPKVKQL